MPKSKSPFGSTPEQSCRRASLSCVRVPLALECFGFWKHFRFSLGASRGTERGVKPRRWRMEWGKKKWGKPDAFPARGAICG